ncbi:hypothetical protein [Pleomorphomonas oryzae]|uniref:hypothetical protein n=1 Tax=Pleomorphomonas oryzae TaxID=261934 RepID=UPI0004256913|nr:hypothetical protein [Pleomorphomonas oryzae]
MRDAIATSPEIIAEVGLLWLRANGGEALVQRSGRLYAGQATCPVAFVAFEVLERDGLVASARADGVHAQLIVALTAAGKLATVSDEATARYRRLMHGRFED